MSRWVILVHPERVVWLGTVVLLTVAAACTQGVADFSHEWISLTCWLVASEVTADGAEPKPRVLLIPLWDHGDECLNNGCNMTASSCITLEAILGTDDTPAWLLYSRTAHAAGTLACIMVAIVVTCAFAASSRVTRNIVMAIGSAVLGSGSLLVVGLLGLQSGSNDIKNILLDGYCRTVNLRPGFAIIISVIGTVCSIVAGAIALGAGYTTDLSANAPVRHNNRATVTKIRGSAPNGRKSSNISTIY